MDLQPLIKEQIESSIALKNQVLNSSIETIEDIVKVIIKAYNSHNKVLWFGNGGSAADAQHLSAELVGKFNLNRKALASIALTTNTSILSAIGNDFDFNDIFSRQVEAHVKEGDVVIGISTSGKSQNVIQGLELARQMGGETVALVGETSEMLNGIAQYVVQIPSQDTPRIQEAHIMVGHIICCLVEQELFGHSTQ